MLGPRAAPLTWMGPKRFHDAPLAPEELPPLDVVILSHDHYDHLDYWTVQRMSERDVTWVTSMGCGAHLEAFGVRPSKIRELDWWEETEVNGLRIVATPARHFRAGARRQRRRRSGRPGSSRAPTRRCSSRATPGHTGARSTWRSMPGTSPSSARSSWPPRTGSRC
ncbi:MAG: hypothetical protein GY913_36125 [Proteobacteria bacterium]|nr:hypothetical protein [Pseudomonadota bacterium]MCP4922359.1 hypothetical protein [Pseudomonadota bacterium]